MYIENEEDQFGNDTMHLLHESELRLNATIPPSNVAISNNMSAEVGGVRPSELPNNNNNEDED